MVRYVFWPWWDRAALNSYLSVRNSRTHAFLLILARLSQLARQTKRRLLHLSISGTQRQAFDQHTCSTSGVCPDERKNRVVTAQVTYTSEVQQLVAEFVSSGMGRSEFCRSRGLRFSTLDRHLKKRRSKRKRRRQEAWPAGRLSTQWLFQRSYSLGG